MRGILCMVLMLSSSVIYSQRATSSVPPSRQKQKKESSFKRVFYGEPGKAALYSLIAPGGGQIYNKAYWKVPLVWAGEGYAIYHLSNSISSYNRLNDCHTALVLGDTDTSAIICDGQTSTGTVFTGAQSARQQKELAWVFVGGAHLLNVLDAFIHRHLINFDTSEDLTIFSVTESSFSLASTQITIARIRIPLN